MPLGHTYSGWEHHALFPLGTLGGSLGSCETGFPLLWIRELATSNLMVGWLCAKVNEFTFSGTGIRLEDRALLHFWIPRWIQLGDGCWQE